MNEPAAPINPYPDWSGQWARVGSLNWEPDGYEKAGPPPLTPEYQAIREQYLAQRAQGILAGDPPATCLPPGMPRVMTMSFPMEIIVTPKLTYIYADWESQVRRVYTDGRDWPEYILPEFNGYSIGQWHDENGDGVYDMLSIETRGMKGPRSFDSAAVVLHENNETVVQEEIRRIDESTLEDRITTIDDCADGPVDGRAALQPRERKSRLGRVRVRRRQSPPQARRRVVLRQRRNRHARSDARRPAAPRSGDALTSTSALRTSWA